MLASDPTVAVALLCAVALPLLLAWLARIRRRREHQPPSAGGWLPLVGHALWYKRDPAAFVTEACKAVGPCFSLDLAGKRMVVVAAFGNDSRAAVRQVAFATESQLSSRQAIADVGFLQMLGRLNVEVGPDIHKRLVKEAYGSAPKLAVELPQLYGAIGRAIASQIPADGLVGDLFGLMRLTMLRASIERMLGRAVAAAAGEAFVASFMAFQDMVEATTAKAAVLPRTISLPLFLWPTQRRRRAVCAQLCAAIEAALAQTSKPAGEGLGPWGNVHACVCAYAHGQHGTAWAAWTTSTHVLHAWLVAASDHGVYTCTSQLHATSQLYACTSQLHACTSQLHACTSSRSCDCDCVLTYEVA